MKKRYIVEYVLSDNDRRTIKEIANLSIFPHIDYDNDLTRKTYNTLTNEKVLTKNQLNNILDLLNSVSKTINYKNETFEKEFENKKLPESTNQFELIQNPKEFYKMIVENYKFQKRNIESLITILVVSNEEE